MKVKERFSQFLYFKRGQMCISLLRTSPLSNQNPAFIFGIRYPVICGRFVLLFYYINLSFIFYIVTSFLSSNMLNILYLLFTMQSDLHSTNVSIDRLIRAEAGQHLYLLTRTFCRCDPTCGIYS